MGRTWKKSEIVLLCISLLVIIAVIAGVTYSYFSVTILGNEDANETQVTAGVLAVDFETSEYINNPDMRLIKDTNRATEAEKSIFTVKTSATATIGAKYDVYLTNLVVSNNFKSADLKWELIKDGVVINSGNFASLGSATELKLTSSNINLALGSTHSFELRLWLSETLVDQSNLYNGSFSGKVKIEAVA